VRRDISVARLFSQEAFRGYRTLSRCVRPRWNRLRSPRALDSRGSLRSSVAHRVLPAVLASPVFVESARPSAFRQGSAVRSVVARGGSGGSWGTPHLPARAPWSQRSLTPRVRDPLPGGRPRASRWRNRLTEQWSSGPERVPSASECRATWGRAGPTCSWPTTPGGTERGRPLGGARTRQAPQARAANEVSEHDEERSRPKDATGAKRSGAEGAGPGAPSGRGLSTQLRSEVCRRTHRLSGRVSYRVTPERITAHTRRAAEHTPRGTTPARRPTRFQPPGTHRRA
jgi:hypothetical protein